ncbi:MAG: hypothetical protein ASARMPRED_004777 [Alectoria sarmentosa]|nr:MAG: hypothetical protein ASARMPRED_004777 [Alectoria sarmentosa]
MSSLLSLSPELWTLIAETLYNEAHPSRPLKALNLVCRRFHNICSRILFRLLSIPLTDEDPGRCAALLKVLQENAAIRASVEVVTVTVKRVGMHGYHEDLNEGFRQLVGELPRLRDVRFEGDAGLESYDMVDLRPIDPSILTVVDKLPGQVRLAIDCYVHTANPDARLQALSCLDSLRVCLLHKPRLYPHGGGPGFVAYRGGNAAEDVAEIVKNNRRLRHLHVVLQGASVPGVPEYRLFLETKSHALEIIGRSVLAIQSLVLEGELSFTQKSLDSWTTPFLHLQSLSIIGVPLVEETTKYLRGHHLPCLHTLTLSAFKDASTKTTFENDSTSIKAFLASLTLTRLTLLGFKRDILLHAVECTGSSLRCLSSHVRESALDLSMRYGPVRAGPFLRSMLLSGEDVAVIKAACPSLECIDLDVLASSPPRAGQKYVPATTPQAAAAASSEQSSTPSDLDTCGAHLPSFSPDLQPLLSIPTLQSLSLFVHKDDTRHEHNPSLETTPGIIRLYAFLRSLKQRPGRFPDVSVSIEINGAVVIWKTRNEGPRTVVVERRGGRRVERQGWDWSRGTRVEEWE